MEQEVVLDVKVKNQGLKQQLREAVQEAQALQERFGATSQEAINAAKKVANIKEEISDMNQVFKVFNPEEKFNAIIGVTQGIAGGFQAVTGAMQLFGSQTKDVEKALLKVQAATAFAEGLNNIRSLGDSFGNLRLMIMDGIRSLGTLKGALIATGIGAFAVAVGLIVQNWEQLKNWIDKTIPSLGGIENLFSNIKKVAFGTLSSIVEGFKVVGEVIGNVFTGEFSKAVDVAGTFGSRVSKAYTAGFLEEEKKQADERRAALLETQNKEHERTLKVLEAQGKDTYAFKRKLLNDELELLKLQGKKETDEYKNKLTEIRVLDAEHKRKIDEANIQRAANIAEAKRKIAETNASDLANAEDDIKNLDEKVRKLRGEFDQKQNEALEKASEQRRANNEKIKKDNEKFVADSIAAEQAVRDAKIQIAQQTLNGITAIAEMGIKNEKKLEQFRKAAALVQIGIDTAMAISSGIANAARFAKNPLMLALSIATTIATVLTNMAKARQILASANTGGGTPSLSTSAASTTTSATTTGEGVTGMQAPQQVGQGIANANAINNALNNPNMIRAVVVETDITDSQRRVRGIEDRATFG